jgi:PIN domain nuclease of toxin-antitoxin system
MIYLIDTHILIWLIIETNKLPKNIFQVLKNKNNKIFISAVSIWEIAIKVSIGKLIFPFELKNIIKEISEMNISVLDITSEHLIKVADLPFHHKDPFDRLIISQSIIENIPIISSENIFSKYNIEIFW